MFSTFNSRLLQRSFLMRLLKTAGLCLAFMTASAAGVHADDVTAIGVDGTVGLGDPVIPNVLAGPGGPATAVATGNPASASATGGNGGITYGEGSDSPGGDASASSTADSTGSDDALSFANATGGNFGVGGFGDSAAGGSAAATADASATGSGRAIATAVATTGESSGGFPPVPVPVANATSSAETAQGAMAQALSTVNFLGESEGTAESTAKTSLGGVSVQSTVAAPTSSTFGFGPTTDAVAQGGSAPAAGGDGFAVSTVLTDKAYATKLIEYLGGASNFADALLGPQDEIFGTAEQFALPAGTATSTFDFRDPGDLILGVIEGFDFDITINGEQVFSGDSVSDTVINLGSNFGPNIDLTINGFGAFVIGGAVPEPSTWAMVLLGFAGLGFAGYRQGAKPQAA
jgi:hypothetical protein